MKILICGGGALGSHLAYLARDLAGCDWSVIDFDRVETKNLAAQWFVKPMVGKNKATALKLQLQNFYGLRIRDYTVRLAAENVATILGEHELIVDCFDNAESRQLVQDYVRQSGVPCVHGGLAADGEFGVVRWDKDFTIDSEDVPGRATCEGDGFLPLILNVSQALAASVRRFVKHEGEQRNWNVSPLGAESFSA